MLTEQEVFERFIKAVDAAGGQRPWAATHGFTPSYINDMVNRRRGLSIKVLAMIGVEMEVTIIYREIPNDSQKDSQPRKTPKQKR